MALQEYYNTGDDADTAASPVLWKAQTWTTTSAYTITSVKLKLFRPEIAPDNLIVSIRVTDDDGKPTGGDLTSGSIVGSTVTEGTPGDFIEIPLTNYSLSNATKYAIVMRVDTRSTSWRLDASSPSYGGGEVGASGDSGSSWTMFSTLDAMFEVYGSSTTYSELSGTIASESSVSGDMNITEIITLSGTIAASSFLSANLGFTEVQLTLGSTIIKRLVVAGKDRIYYEDI